MSTVGRLLRRLWHSAAGRSDEARFQEELADHLERQAAENRRAGMSPQDARRQAVLRFGPVEAVRDCYRDEQGLPVVDQVIQDVRYTFRQLRQAPLFALTAVLSLAIGIGANTALFTAIERVLLRPLPVSNPDELVYVTDDRILAQARPGFSYPYYRVLRDTGVLSGFAARAGRPLNLTLNGESLRVRGELVSGNYFELLGIGTRAGRPLSSEDDRTPGERPVAVISEPFWRRTFASDAQVVGRAVALNGQAFTIVGVAADGFTGADIWIPFAMQPAIEDSLLDEARTNWLEIVGRLRPNQDRDGAAEVMTRRLEQRASELPPGRVRPIVLLPGITGNSPARGELQSAFFILTALTALALALACVNVACLAGVRSAHREKELTIRLALGAGRGRLSRQLLTEGLVLAMLAGVTGAFIAPWVARALGAARWLPTPIEAGLGPGAMGFVVLVSVLAGCGVSVLPILACRKIRLTEASAASPATGMAFPRLAAQDLAVVLQVAMALAMLTTAALLVQSARGLRSVDPGFRADNLLLATLDARAAGYDSTRIGRFWRDVLDRVRQLPAVQTASLGGTVPLAPGRQRQKWVSPSTGEESEIDTNFVASRYFGTLGIPVVAGRDFDDDDDHDSRLVVIVNERLARMFWPDGNPVGKGLRLPDAGSPPIAEVVGVVRDVKYRDLRGDASPMTYRPILQTRSTDSMTLHVRAAGDADADALVAAIRLAVSNVDPKVPLFAVTTLENLLDSSFAQTRQAAALTGTFGALALLLSGVGIYGVTALAVRRRTREIGIRMALGARWLHIALAIGLRGARLVALGLGLGLVGAFVFAQVTGTLLFGVATSDAGTFASMAGLLAAVSALAVTIPIRAATRIDAVAAMREE